MAAFDRISCTAIAVMEFVIGQVGFKADASWHGPVLQQHAATPYHCSTSASMRRDLVRTVMGSAQSWGRCTGRAASAVRR